MSPRPPARHRPSPLAPQLRRSDGFTIVEVMMAAVILVVGFMGMIQAVTIGSEMLATARRQNLASQIIDHEIGRLRLQDWSTISGLTSSSAATYSSDLTALNTAIAGSGVTFTLARTVSTPVTNLREVTFTVTWTKSGTTTAAASTSGSWFEKLAFYRETPVARTYTRQGSTWFSAFGTSLGIRRS